MASYGPIYEFAFDSQNGADILIVISKKSYTGAVTRRPLGRAPILKRENNENIYGTSLEIYAECKVDGEYAEFYTSSADEFKVDVYKDQVSIWTGFITPELYSEPDIAPPYDVQIIATDGLGELRDLTFYSNETKSVYEHIKSMLDALNTTRLYGIISDLKYVSGDFVSGAAGLFDMRVNLEHEVGNNCYDVLQNILRSINASMTLYGDSWLIFRKTDFIRLAEEDWVHGAYSNGHETLYPVAEFGSMDKTNWWPIGQMSSVIEPAKKSIVFQAPNHYKRNVLSDAWVANNSASYDNVQKAYTLPSKDSYITQHIDFGAEIGYALSLKIKAMNVGAPIYDKGNYIDQGIGVRVKVVDEEGRPMYLESLDSDRGIGSYHWVLDESTWIEGDLALPALSDRKSDAQEVEIIIPLYVSTPMSKAIATSIDVTVFNIDGAYPINVYDISLGAHDQAPGYEANVVLNNNAREEGDSVETTFSDAYRLANAGYIFMSGIPMLPYQDVAIGSWQINDGEARDYVTTMSEDYAMQSALPRMSYRGVLNVPRANLPVLFLRDGTYYFPRTYSYNLYDDELEVELISVPAADVEVSSIVVSEYTPSYGASSGSSGGSGSGGGSGIGGGIDLSGYAKKEEVTTLSELLASMWTLDEDGNLVTEKNLIIKKNLTIGGDMASDGEGGQGTVTGVTGISLNGKTYTDENNDGIIDLGTITSGLTTVSWTDVQGRPTKLTEFTNDAGFITSAALNGYAKTSDLPTSLPASDVYAWAKKSSLAVADVPDLSSKYLSVNGGTIKNGNNGAPLVIDTTHTEIGVPFRINNISKGWVGHTAAVGTYLYDYTSGKFIGVKTDGTPVYYDGSYRTLYHTGNFNPANYLPLNGGTLTASKREVLYLNTTAAYCDLTLQINKVDKAVLSYDATHGVYVYNYPSGKYIGVKDDGTPYYNNGSYNTLIHSGNIGSQKVERARYIETQAYDGSKWYADEYRLYAKWSASNILGLEVEGGYPIRVNQATKLETARTIWGQLFDGTGNVSGALSGVGAITRSFQYAVDADQAGNLTFKTNVTEWKFNNSAGTTIVAVNGASNNVGIGTNNPAYKLDVTGTAYATYFRTASISIDCDADGVGGNHWGEINRFASSLYVQNRTGNLYLSHSAGTTYIRGLASIAGAVTMSSSLTVNGNTIINGTVTLPVNYQIQWGTTGHMIYGMQNRIQIDAPLRVSGNTDINGNLVVAGDISA